MQVSLVVGGACCRLQTELAVPGRSREGGLDRLDDMFEAFLRLILGRPRTRFVPQKTVVARLVGLKVGMLLSSREDLATNRLIQGRVQRLVLAVVSWPWQRLL